MSLFSCVAVPQELNNRLAAEIARLRTLLTGDTGGEATGSPLTQGKDAYELEVHLELSPPLPSSALHEPQVGAREGLACSVTAGMRLETVRGEGRGKPPVTPGRQRGALTQVVSPEEGLLNSRPPHKHEPPKMKHLITIGTDSSVRFCNTLLLRIMEVHFKSE